MEKNQFRLADVILSVICVVFVAEAAAPVASIGNSQYFWWIFMILAFLLPYGLIAAELGTAYAGDGGLYDWIHAAYPNGKWAARASWYYWINFPLWMASLAVMCPELITFITGRSLGTFGSLVVELLFIWIVTLIACYPVCDSIIILNVSAVIKIVLALLVGGLGVWYISRYGFVNDMSARTFLPSFDLNSLSYISVIIFNFLGFEVVCTYANNMSDPKKQIPQSIVTGGIVIAAIYLFSAFGIGAAVDVREISVDSGLIDAVSLILGGSGGVLTGEAWIKQTDRDGDSETWIARPELTFADAKEAPAVQGGVQLTHKQNKRVAEDMTLTLSMAAGESFNWEMRGTETKLDELSAESLTALQEDGAKRMAAQVLRGMLTLPQEDLAFIQKGLSQEAWQRILNALGGV